MRLEKLKNDIRDFVNLFQWNLLPYKKDSDKEVSEAIDSLREKSFYIYKNFFNQNELSNLKKIIYSELGNQQSSIRKEILYRQRTVFSRNSSVFQKLMNNKFISTISRKFYNSNYVDFMKITYELKKGVGEMTHEKVKNVNEEFQYHCDRSYGWLKFCIFLKDVSSENGPFSIIPETHKWPKNYNDLKYRYSTFLDTSRVDGTFVLPSFKKEEIKKYFNVESEEKLIGKEGDLMLVNTAAYHKGDNLKQGCTREVLWIYTKFPSYFDSFTGKIKSVLKKN